MHPIQTRRVLRVHLLPDADPTRQSSTLRHTDTIRFGHASTSRCAGRLASPCPASSHGRLESLLDRGISEITIFTQCSLSRLSRLENMCNRWTGVVSAAIIAEGGKRVDRRTREEVSALHARVESGGKCRLDISLCQEAPGMAAGDGLYPVNSLRNVALEATRTDLVLSLVSSTRLRCLTSAPQDVMQNFSATNVETPVVLGRSTAVLL